YQYSSHSGPRAAQAVAFTFHGSRITFQLLSAFLAACLFLTGCLRHETKADIVIVNGNEPESLDPAIVTGISEMRITKALFEGLLRLDPHNAQPVPGLADSWESSPDARIYKFHLRTNALWSTGEPITSQDVLYSWLRALS